MQGYGERRMPIFTRSTPMLKLQICDLNIDRARALAAVRHLNAYDSHREMLKEADRSVATSPRFRPRQNRGRLCQRRQAHVGGKPWLPPGRRRALVEAAERNNVGHGGFAQSVEPALPLLSSLWMPGTGHPVSAYMRSMISRVATDMLLGSPVIDPVVLRQPLS